MRTARPSILCGRPRHPGRLRRVHVQFSRMYVLTRVPSSPCTIPLIPPVDMLFTSPATDQRRTRPSRRIQACSPKLIFDIRFGGPWGIYGVMDHAARASRIIRDCSTTLAGENFRELVRCVSPCNPPVCHPEPIMGGRYRCGYQQTQSPLPRRGRNHVPMEL